MGPALKANVLFIYLFLLEAATLLRYKHESKWSNGRMEQSYCRGLSSCQYVELFTSTDSAESQWPQTLA